MLGMANYTLELSSCKLGVPVEPQSVNPSNSAVFRSCPCAFFGPPWSTSGSSIVGYIDVKIPGYRYRARRSNEQYYLSSASHDGIYLDGLKEMVGNGSNRSLVESRSNKNSTLILALRRDFNKLLDELSNVKYSASMKPRCLILSI